MLTEYSNISEWLERWGLRFCGKQNDRPIFANSVGNVVIVVKDNKPKQDCDFNFTECQKEKGVLRWHYKSKELIVKSAMKNPVFMYKRFNRSFGSKSGMHKDVFFDRMRLRQYRGLCANPIW